MDINRILFLIATLNLGSDLANVYKYRERLPTWMKILVGGAFSICILAWFIANSICGYIAGGVLAAYLITMRIYSRKRNGRDTKPWPATKFLIALNCIGFGIQYYYGATESLRKLVSVGAMYTGALEHGEYWRLLSAQYLHLGALHLACNMLGLSFLGAIVERALGWWRYFLGYTLCGVGGMLIAWAAYKFGFDSSPVVMVGASASVLGLVGMSAAQSLLSYRRSRSAVARAQLWTMGQIVAMQVVFDSLVPEVSSVAHLGGAATGFIVGLVLARKRSH